MAVEIVLPRKLGNVHLLMACVWQTELLVRLFAPKGRGQMRGPPHALLVKLDTQLPMRAMELVLVRRWRVFVMQATGELVTHRLVYHAQLVDTKEVLAMSSAPLQ